MLINMFLMTGHIKIDVSYKLIRELDMPLVTIAIPFYNSERYLSDAIWSVLNQTYVDWELLLLNDGSTDGSLNIAESFTDRRIKVVSDGLNKGLVYRLNKSIEMANGIYYARMDADDIMHPNRIEMQVDFLQKNTQIDVVGTAWYSIDCNNRILSCNVPSEFPNHKYILKNICFLHPSVMGHVKWFNENKYDSLFVRIEDSELWLRTISNSNFQNLMFPLMYYREFGIPHLSKYVKTQLSAFRLYIYPRKYSFSLMYCLAQILSRGLKCIVYTLFSIFKREDVLVWLRKRKRQNYNKSRAYEELSKALKREI